MITTSHKEKEGEQIYKKFDMLLEENIDKVNSIAENSIADIKKLRDFSISLAKSLHGFQHMYYELFFKIYYSNRIEFSDKHQLKMYIYSSAQNNLELGQKNHTKLIRRKALDQAIDTRLTQNSLAQDRKPIDEIEKKFRKTELDIISSENKVLIEWKENLSDPANKFEAQSFLQGFANYLTNQKQPAK